MGKTYPFRLGWVLDGLATIAIPQKEGVARGGPWKARKRGRDREREGRREGEEEERRGRERERKEDGWRIAKGQGGAKEGREGGRGPFFYFEKFK